MTKNENSPENLRKFLESDDPAMRRMGLSMAMGSGVPKELYKNVFGLSLWDPEEENREAAGELVEEIGLENITEFPEWLEPFDEEDVDTEVRGHAAWHAARALGKIGDARAIELLIKTLTIPGETGYGNSEAVWALGEIGDARAVGPLIDELLWGGELLDDEHTEASHCKAVPGELARIGESMRAQGVSVDRKDIEPLIVALNDDGWWLPLLAAESLEGLGWKPETDEQKAAYHVASHDWAGCIQMGEHVIKKAVGYLASLFDRRGPSDWSYGSEIKWSLVKGFGEVAVIPLIAALEGEDEESRMHAAHALGELGDSRAVEPLITALEDEEGFWRAEEALEKLGHEVE
jgi:HEAT repeat protein